MEKEFTRYKAQSKEEIERNEKTMEEMEGKISEVSGAASKSSKMGGIAIDPSFDFFFQLGSKECRVLEEKARQCTGGSAPAEIQNMTQFCFPPGNQNMTQLFGRPIWRARSRRSTTWKHRLSNSRTTYLVSRKPMLMRSTICCFIPHLKTHSSQF